MTMSVRCPLGSLLLIVVVVVSSQIGCCRPTTSSGGDGQRRRSVPPRLFPRSVALLARGGSTAPKHQLGNETAQPPVTDREEQVQRQRVEKAETAACGSLQQTEEFPYSNAETNASSSQKCSEVQQKPTRISRSEPQERKRASLPYFQTEHVLERRESEAREDLRGDRDARCESGVDEADLPVHVAVVMDGNRRYGRARYGDDEVGGEGNLEAAVAAAARGHWEGSRKLLEFAKWCIAEKIKVLTVFAFSTENWNRDQREVTALMDLFARYCVELREEAVSRNIRVRVLSTETSRIPPRVAEGLERLQADTARCDGGLTLNLCLSYGGRGDIVRACRQLVGDCEAGRLDADGIDERAFGRALLSHGCPDPDILIRTSGEIRLSNFLLWQLAYSELFFVDRHWPELKKDDLLRVIRSYAKTRRRRFGK